RSGPMPTEATCRTSPRPFSRILQYRFRLDSEPVSRKARPEGGVARANVFAIHGRPGSNAIHAAREGDLHCSGCAFRKNFRTSQAGQRLALERTIALFRPAGSEGENRARS